MANIRQFIQEQIEAQQASIVSKESGQKVTVKIDFMSDEEPDDRGAHTLFLSNLVDLSKQYPTVDFQVTFWTGKGDAAIKQRTLKKILNEVPPIAGCTMEVLQGYSSTSKFNKEGHAFLDESEINEIRDHQDVISNESVEDEFIRRMQRDNNQPHYIICAKPPTELIGVLSRADEIFRRSYLAISGGNNLREIKSGNKVKRLFDAFKKTYDLESSYNKTKYSKSFTEKEFPELFDALANITINNRQPFLEHMRDWNAYICTSDLNYFHDIIDADNTLAPGEKHALKEKVSNEYNAGWTRDRASFIKSVLNLAPYIDKQGERALTNKETTDKIQTAIEKYATSKSLSVDDITEEEKNFVSEPVKINVKEKIKETEKYNLSRRMNKWFTLTEKGLSFLSVDEELLMFVLGHDDYLCAMPCSFDFDAIETTGKVIKALAPSEQQQTPIYAILPKTNCTSVEAFLSVIEALWENVKELEFFEEKIETLDPNSPLLWGIQAQLNEQRHRFSDNHLAITQKNGLKFTGEKLLQGLNRIFPRPEKISANTP